MLNCWNLSLQRNNYRDCQRMEEKVVVAMGAGGDMLSPSICETAVQLIGIMYCFWWIMMIRIGRIGSWPF